MPIQSSFTDKVRQSKIKHPTQRGFSEQKWREDYQNFGEQSVSDETIYFSGLWFDKKLNGIRQKLNDLKNIPFEKEILIRLYVGLINREYNVSIEHIDKNKKSKTSINLAGELIEKKIPIGPGGYEINPVSVIETIVSAIRYPLADLFNGHILDNSIQLSDLEIIEILRYKANLASLYDMYSEFWSDCLWNEWYVDEKDTYDNIRPPATSEYLSQVLSRHRIGTLLMEMTFRSMDIWKKLPPLLKSKEIDRLIITNITRKKGKKILKVGRNKDTKYPDHAFVAGLYAEEIYWNEILIEPLPKLNGINIRELISIHRVLQSLGKIIASNSPKDTSVKKSNKLLQYSPLFSKLDLIAALKKTTGLSIQKINNAINTLTFSGSVRDDIWHKPIIPISDSVVTFVLPALMVPNLIRSIEYWMKTGGIDLSVRGFMYEKYFIEEVSKHCKNTQYFQNAIIDSGKVVLGNQSEEIDFIFIFGDTVVIGEIKCSFYPATALETYKYYEILDGASSQVERKADFVKTNINEFRKRYIKYEHLSGSNINVIPLVLTNLHHGVGVPVRGVPVVDMYILFNYFTGKQDFLVEISDDGFCKPNITKKFYSSFAEAESNIFNYLKSPPLFSILSKIIDSETMPLPILFEDEKQPVYTRFYVNEKKWLKTHKG
ncbi:MAG: hypothetical protein D3915_01220 [Candidatus Electrothrix sp. AU1_5]|nr:hypothetical protein [Candidatus Electrothrix gigas]